MVIVTGGLGFIGAHLVEYLYRQGQQDIVVVDREAYPVFRYFPSSYISRYLSVESFNEQIGDYKNADRIYHLGAISDTTERNEHKIQYYNTSFSKHLISFCINNHIPLTYASSASVYGNTRNFKEDTRLSPESLYARSKAMIDEYIEEQIRLNPAADIQSLRFFNVYGQYEDHKNGQASPVSKFIKEACQNKTIRIFEGSASFFRDFICVDDVIAILIKLSLTDAKGIYNVGTGSAVSFLQVAEYISARLNAEIEIIPFPDKLKKQYQPYTKADLTKISTFIKEHRFIRIEEYLGALLPTPVS